MPEPSTFMNVHLAKVMLLTFSAPTVYFYFVDMLSITFP